MTDDPLAAFLGPEYARIAQARTALEEACAGVMEMAADVHDFTPMGTRDLPVAVAALASSEYADEDNAGARWVSRTFTATPAELIPLGGEALAFGGAVLLMRFALGELDEALAAVHPGPAAPGGTFSA